MSRPRAINLLAITAGNAGRGMCATALTRRHLLYFVLEDEVCVLHHRYLLSGQVAEVKRVTNLIVYLIFDL